MKTLKIYLALFLCGLISCNKDELKNDRANLIGRWNWVYTQRSYGWCEYNSFYETITPSSANKNYSVEFLEKGKLHRYENDKLVEKNRIVFNYFEAGNDGTYYFYFYLDNDIEKGIAGSIHGDTLHFDYPFVEENPDCENYLNFLVRE